MSKDPVQMDAPKPGEVIAGKYKVEAVLGKGGMGLVVTAYHVDLNQRVAIKLLRREIAETGEAVERFLREARASARIQSEHIARIHDVGRLDSGVPYIVMEHLTGTDLNELLRARGPLPIVDVADYLLQVCEALAEAHAQGIVHRDLKPGNLFLTRHADSSPLVKVLDFGISKFIDGEGPRRPQQELTSTSDVIGSPWYMSPEQIKSSKTVDSRTDVWALGVVLHKLLTQRQPFEAETVIATIANILDEPPIPLRAHRPDAPPELERLIQSCLEKDRTRRLQTVADFAQALLPFAPPGAGFSVERIVRVLVGSDFISKRTLPFVRRRPMSSQPSPTERGGNTTAAVVSRPRIEPTGSPARAVRNAALIGGGVALSAVAVLTLAWVVFKPAPEASSAAESTSPVETTPPTPPPPAETNTAVPPASSLAAPVATTLSPPSATAGPDPARMPPASGPVAKREPLKAPTAEAPKPALATSAGSKPTKKKVSGPLETSL